ncbi:MAG: GDP-mannose 4,6-dehydratase [Deltaproteobacteria bacterium]|nr:GDP-mannose 4,6-dehydratase [Deltaproteobacteria bacterium]
MRVLLTGAAGFIGSHLAARLLRRGHEVVAFDNFDPFYDPAIKERNVAALGAHAGFTLQRGDIRDAALVADLLGRSPGFDSVVHLAALAGVRPSIAQPLRYASVNVTGTLTLLEACREHGLRRFVFASSSSVYGAHSPVPFREADPAVRPASPYAATKRAGELLCSSYTDLFGMDTCALRFFTVYGPRQRPEMAIHKFTRLIAAARPVPFFGDGRSARDYTFVDDIIDGVTAAVERQPAGHTVYNLGGSRTTTLARLVELIARELGKPPILDRQPDQPGDVPITYADVTKAGRDLGYAPKVPIEEGIARFVEWFRAPPA